MSNETRNPVWRIIVIALAIIGGFAVLGFIGMSLMHLMMMGSMMGN